MAGGRRKKSGCTSTMQYLWVTLVTKKANIFQCARTHTHAHSPLLIPWHLHRPRCSDGLLDNRDNGAAVFHIGPGVYYSSGLALFPKRSNTKSPNLLFSRPCGSRVKAHLWTCMCHFIWCHYANGTARFTCAKKTEHTRTHTPVI